MQLELFPDIELVPTPSLARGDSSLHQCRHCGTLVCIPGTDYSIEKKRPRVPGPCNVCNRNAGWIHVPLGTGPFKPTTKEKQ